MDTEVKDDAINYLDEAYTKDLDKEGSRENVKEQLQVLDAAKEESEVDAFLEIMEDDAKAADGSVEEPKEEEIKEKPKEEESDNDAEEEKTVEKEAEENESETEAPSQNPPKADKDEDKVNEINDEFIESYPDKADVKILSKLKGMKLDDNALKMLIHAQRLVGEKNPIEETKTQYDEINEDNPIPGNIPKQLELGNDELKNKAELEIFRRLKQDPEYADMPKNPEELKEYLVDMNVDDPLKFHKFFEDKKAISNEVETVLNRGIYLQKNSRKVNNAILKKEIANIKSELKEYGLEDLTDLGLNLEFTTDEKGNYRNDLIEQLMLDGDNLDQEVVTYIGEKPILLQGQIQNKFFRMKGKELFQKAIKAAEKRARLEKFENLETKKKKTLNSFSESGIGASDKKNNFNDIVNGNDEQAIDAMLESIEHNI